MQIVEKQKKQDLGIFYTPPEVVSFVFDILNIWKNKEDKETKRWQSRKPHSHYPSVIDPAVGEGVFLKGALESGFTKPDWVFGADIDEQAVKRWQEVNLLADFGGEEENLKAHFFHQNGLLNIKWDQHKDKYKGKLRPDNIQNHQFDVAVGNPPYGGLGIYDDMKALSETISSSAKVSTISTQTLNTLFGEEIERQIKESKTIHKDVRLPTARLLELKDLSGALLGFEIWKDKNYIANRVDFPLSINNVPFNLKNILTPRETEKLKSFPIEILFVERFIQLVKPGGWIAAIIPDGILSNSNAHYVRDFIAGKTKVEAIVSLPRETFKQAGTSAKTSILFLRKLNEIEKPPLDHPVFLATAEKISEDAFKNIVRDYIKFYK